MKRFLLTFLIVVYTPNNKTEAIKVFNLKEDEPLIEIVCAEGVSRSECREGEKPKKRVDSISYEEIQNFVIDGPFQF